MQRQVLTLGGAFLECVVDEVGDTKEYCLKGTYKNHLFEFKDGELIGWRNGKPGVFSPKDEQFPEELYDAFCATLVTHLLPPETGDRRLPLPSHLGYMVATATGVIPPPQ